MLCPQGVTVCHEAGSAARNEHQDFWFRHIYLTLSVHMYVSMIGGKEEKRLFSFSAFSNFMLREERARSRVPRAGGGSSGVAHQARGAGKRLAHAHALPIDAQGARLDGQLVLQLALGRQQQLQRVLRLPQPQLEGLQSVIDGEHLVQEPEARAEGKHSSARCSTHTHTYCVPGTVPGAGRLQGATQARLSR